MSAMTRRTTSTKGYYANRTPEQIENDQRTRAAWYQKNKKKQRRVQKARQEARRGVYQPDDSVTTHTATEITKVLNGVERSGFRNRSEERRVGEECRSRGSPDP